MRLLTCYIEDMYFLKEKEKSRDKDIYFKCKEGVPVGELSDMYRLSPRYIQFILKNRKLLEEWEQWIKRN